jgi:hypothetical protein
MSFIDLMKAASGFVDSFISATKYTLENAGAATVQRHFRDTTAGALMRDGGVLSRDLFEITLSFRKKDDEHRSAWRHLTEDRERAPAPFSRAVISELVGNVDAKFWVPMIDRISAAKPHMLTSVDVHALAEAEGWM